jgi:hypothetical protein
MSTLDKGQLDRLRTLIVKHGLERVAGSIEEAARGCVRLTIAGKHDSRRRGMTRLGGEADLPDSYFALQEELGGPDVGGRGGMHQVLGYPYMTDTEWLRKGGEEWLLLFQMDSDERVGISWWDAGLLHVLIRQDDLAARRFDRVQAGIYTS